MADKKISQLTAATTPLDGTEVLPIVQSGTTVKVQNNDLRPKQIQSNATSGVLQIAGPAASTTRVMTTPNANFTAARTDAAQDFTGNNTFDSTTLCIDATNHRVGIGTATPTRLFTIYGGSGTARVIFQNSGTGTSIANGLDITEDSSGNASVWNYSNGYLRFATNNVQRVTIDSSGDTTLNTGNIIQGTAAKGVNFTANTAAAGMTSQLLNWYEEGTWTPTITASSSNPTVTYGLQRGLYTRIGRQVTVVCYMTWSAFSGGSGDVYFSGLPFTIEGSTGAYGAAAIASLDGATYAAGRTAPALLVLANTTNLRLACMGSNIATTTIPVGSIAASGNVVFTCTYFV